MADAHTGKYRTSYDPKIVGSRNCCLTHNTCGEYLESKYRQNRMPAMRMVHAKKNQPQKRLVSLTGRYAIRGWHCHLQLGGRQVARDIDKGVDIRSLLQCSADGWNIGELSYLHHSFYCSAPMHAMHGFG